MRKNKLFVFFITVTILTFFYRAEVRAEKQISIPYVEARNAIAMDCKSKRVLYEKSSQSITPMASTTKIITALVALKYGDLDKKVEISARASSIRGSTVGYKKGEMISIRELLYGLMLRSGNDAAIAIAEGISGSVEEYLEIMNEYAVQIGLTDTHFESPHGLDSQNHYTTAYDLALATCKAKEIKEFNDIVNTKDIDSSQFGFTRSFHNINKILWQMPEANGVKTGYTGQAGKCLVTSVNYEGNDIVIVVINCPGRWKETKKIFDYVTKQYEYKKVVSKDQVISNADISDLKCNIGLQSKYDIIIPVRKNSTINTKVYCPKKVKLPITKEDSLGKLVVIEDNEIVYTGELKSGNSIEKKFSRKKWFHLNNSQ